MPHIRFNLNGQTRTRELLDDVIIGRSAADSTWVVDDRTVSRRHCRIAHEEDGQWLITDLASRSGTLLDGTRIERPTPLHDGDEIRIGATQLTFLVSPVAAPKPDAPGALSEQDLLHLLSEVPSSGLAQLATAGQRPEQTEVAISAATAPPARPSAAKPASFGHLIGDVARDMAERDKAKASRGGPSWREFHVPRGLGLAAIALATIVFTVAAYWYEF